MLRHIIRQSKTTKESTPLDKFTPDSSGDFGIIPATTNAESPQHTHATAAPPKNKNILGSGVEIKGSIRFTDDLTIDGRIEGEVISDGCLIVGENGFIRGEIMTGSVIIFGKVEGNVTAQDRCELKDNAVMTGDITAGNLSMEQGVTFMGQSRVGKKVDSKPSMKAQIPKR
jgi:cytoskeletal protein CcmA (bactofilin family)